MTLYTNAFTRYGASGLREELSNTIYRISPEDTPFMSMAGKGNAKQTLFEWQTDALGSVSTSNAQLEGDEITSVSAMTATARVGNYTQISRKLLAISGTLEAVDKAGRRSELAYQISKAGAELKRDLEAMSLENLAGNAGGTTTARVTAGLGAWVKTNDVISTSGASPVYTSGVPGAARTEGTQVAFTETILKSCVALVYASGGKMVNLMLGPVNKAKASAFSGNVTRNFDISNAPAKPMAIIGAMDVYVSDFGTLRIIPNRFQRERDGWLIDPKYVAIRHLRPFAVKKLATTGDAEKRMLIVEWGLQVKQEAALGLCADLTTT